MIGPVCPKCQSDPCRCTLSIGFFNTQHLTDSEGKKAVIHALMSFNKWTLMLLSETMMSSSTTSPSGLPTFGRDTHNAKLQEFRGQRMATAMSHEEFAATLNFGVVDSYPLGRYATKDRSDQLQYGVVTPRSLSLHPPPALADAKIFGSDASDDLRQPLLVKFMDLHVLGWHAPSGTHPFARRLLYTTAANLQKSGTAFVMGGDFNCAPPEFTKDCKSGTPCTTKARPEICEHGAPHTFETTAGFFIHCPGTATRATGTLDFAISSRAGCVAKVAASLEFVAAFGFDHVPIQVDVPWL